MGVALSHDLLRVSLCCSGYYVVRQTLFALASKCHFYCNKRDAARLGRVFTPRAEARTGWGSGGRTARHGTREEAVGSISDTITDAGAVNRRVTGLPSGYDSYCEELGECMACLHVALRRRSRGDVSIDVLWEGCVESVALNH